MTLTAIVGFSGIAAGVAPAAAAAGDTAAAAAAAAVAAAAAAAAAAASGNGGAAAATHYSVPGCGACRSVVPKERPLGPVPGAGVRAARRRCLQPLQCSPGRLVVVELLCTCRDFAVCAASASASAAAAASSASASAAAAAAPAADDDDGG